MPQGVWASSHATYIIVVILIALATGFMIYYEISRREQAVGIAPTAPGTTTTTTSITTSVETPKPATETKTTPVATETTTTVTETTISTTSTVTPGTSAPTKPSLSEYVKSAVNGVLAVSPVDPGNSGILVLTLDGVVLYSLNPSKPLIPASNMKLLTAAAALKYLGADYRFKTYFLADGEVLNGVLRGNLIVRGTGDPSIVSGDWVDELSKGAGSPYESEQRLEEVVTTLSELGIKRIEGDIIVDDGYLDYQWVHSSWAKDDLQRYYAAQIGALGINRNIVLLKVYPDQTGKARVEVFPDAGYVKVTTACRVVRSKSEVVTSLAAVRTLETNDITIVGDLPMDSGAQYLTVTIHDPGMYFGAVLRSLLIRSGVEVAGAVRRASTASWDNTTVMAVLESKPLAAILKDMLKHSINLYADTLFKVLGKEVGGRGSWDSGSRALAKFLSDAGFAEVGIEIADGSGLSRQNKLTASLLVKLLLELYGNTHFYDSLPVAGVDGTLRNRMRGTNAQGNLRAKTGTLTGISALSGYVSTKDGRVLVFSLIFNGFSVPTSTVKNEVEDRIGDLLASINTLEYDIP